MNFGYSEILIKFNIFEKLFSFSLNYFISIRRSIAKSFSSSNSEKIVIVALHKLGDTVFTIPAIKLIQNKTNFPITIVCYKESKKIYELIIKNVEYLILSKEDFLFNERLARKSPNKKIKEINPKIVFDLTGVMTSASLLYNISAEKIVGFNRPFFSAIYSHFNIVGKLQHSIDIYLNAISTYLPFTNSEVKSAYPIKKNLTNSICICPFAGWAAKEWGIRNFISLAIHYSKKYQVKFLVEKGSIPEDIKLLLIALNIHLVETKLIEELINEINSSSILIGNDSGPIQIAAILGVPTFAIYGPTNPNFHLPFGDDHQFINQVINCTPKPYERLCFTNAGRVGCPSNECLTTLKAEQVLKKLDPFINHIFSKN